MSLKDEFKNWVSSNMPNKSGTASSYVSSLEWLSEKFYENGIINVKSLFEITDAKVIRELHDVALKIQKDPNSYIFKKNAQSLGKKHFFSASLNKYREFLEARTEMPRSNFRLDDLHILLRDSGLIYNKRIVSGFVSSLISKPFLILTGLSGSGKTKLAQAFVQWISENENQYKIVPVGADWTNREPLLGYPNALDSNEYIKPDSGVLDFLIEANINFEKPYFLILDEMNLSQVERYFADFLSVMESHENILLHAKEQNISDVPPKIKLPKNLFIIGTVNIDETTNMFSPKVLDRANTIEFRVKDSEMMSFLSEVREIKMDILNGKGAHMAKSFLELSMDKTLERRENEMINTKLMQFFKELKKTGAEFGYRTASEILRLINNLGKIDDTLSLNQMMDIAIMQKLLPKLHGSRRKLVPVLITLGKFCIDKDLNIDTEVFNNDEFDFNQDFVAFPLSLEKISRMHRATVENGFASFAEA